MILASQYLMYAVVVMNAVAAFIRWRRDRSFPAVLMAVGSIGAALGFSAVQFLGYSTKGVPVGSGAMILQPSAWVVPGRLVLISGLVLFCIGYAIDSFRPKR